MRYRMLRIFPGDFINREGFNTSILADATAKTPGEQVVRDASVPAELDHGGKRDLYSIDV